MRYPDRWDEPDWDWLEPVKFTGFQFRTGSAIMVILLGGLLLAIIAAVWHLVIQ